MNPSKQIDLNPFYNYFKQELNEASMYAINQKPMYGDKMPEEELRAYLRQKMPEVNDDTWDAYFSNFTRNGQVDIDAFITLN